MDGRPRVGTRDLKLRAPCPRSLRLQKWSSNFKLRVSNIRDSRNGAQFSSRKSRICRRTGNACSKITISSPTFCRDSGKSKKRPLPKKARAKNLFKEYQLKAGWVKKWLRCDGTTWDADSSTKPPEVLGSSRATCSRRKEQPCLGFASPKKRSPLTQAYHWKKERYLKLQQVRVQEFLTFSLTWGTKDQLFETIIPARNTLSPIETLFPEFKNPFRLKKLVSNFSRRNICGEKDRKRLLLVILRSFCSSLEVPKMLWALRYSSFIRCWRVIRNWFRYYVMTKNGHGMMGVISSEVGRLLWWM